LLPGECNHEHGISAAEARLLAAGSAFAGAHRIGPGQTTGPLPGALAAMLSQVPVLPEDLAALAAQAGIVAAEDGIHDLRTSNSWMLRLGEVATAECLEVLLVNAAAPFVLAGRLRALMARDPLADKWIVNVAAVEGQFSRRQKDARHPHLNMAKAALNMLTRSAAADYARDRIYMNSVDVGWFSNGEPVAVADAMRGRGFLLPLDEVDAAARVCDPIFSGLRTGTNVHGKLFKDYRPVEW
jgi:NAD(P)-dependent dehydrogenase (short-subunit alcohol dehydrogenase family)